MAEPPVGGSTTSANSCQQCNASFGYFFNRKQECPVCKTPTCSACLVNLLSHPDFPKERVNICKHCYDQTLLLREGQHTETVPGPVANQAMLTVAKYLGGTFFEVHPGQPIKIKRDSLVLKMLNTAKPHSADGWTSEDITYTNSDGTTNFIRWYHPDVIDTSRQYPAFVWTHGGGACAGSMLQMDQDQNYRTFCKRFGIMLFAIEFRLAPEHPFPIPFEDCFTAYKSIVENATKYNVDATKLVTIGESTMPYGLALAALDRKVTPPSFIVAHNAFFFCDKYNKFNSWTALREHVRAEDGQNDVMDGMIMAYLPNPENRTDWRASPGYARTELLSKLPPTMLIMAGYDAVKDDNLEIARVLREAGVKVTSVVASTSWHGFFPRFAEAPELVSQLELILKKHFGL